MQAYLRRLAEQTAVAFGAGVAAALATGEGLGVAALVTGAVTAGVRAAYGVLVKRVNDSERPEIQA